MIRANNSMYHSQTVFEHRPNIEADFKEKARGESSYEDDSFVKLRSIYDVRRFNNEEIYWGNNKLLLLY